MNEEPKLFRDEAVQDYSARRIEGQLLQISPSWTKWMYWLLLAFTVSALAFTAFAKVDRWVVGQGVAQPGGTVLAVFPESARDELVVGRELALRFLDDRRVPIARVYPELFSTEHLKEQFPYAAGFLELQGPVLVIDAQADGPAGANGRVELPSGRVRVLDLLLPERR